MSEKMVLIDRSMYEMRHCARAETLPAMSLLRKEKGSSITTACRFGKSATKMIGHHRSCLVYCILKDENNPLLDGNVAGMKFWFCESDPSTRNAVYRICTDNQGAGFYITCAGLSTAINIQAIYDSLGARSLLVHPPEDGEDPMVYTVIFDKAFVVAENKEPSKIEE